MMKFEMSKEVPLWLITMPPWRNRLARSAVNRKVGGSSPPGGDLQILFSRVITDKKLEKHFSSLPRSLFLDYMGIQYAIW